MPTQPVNAVFNNNKFHEKMPKEKLMNLESKSKQFEEIN